MGLLTVDLVDSDCSDSDSGGIFDLETKIYGIDAWALDLHEVLAAAEAFWLRRYARRRVLKTLAQECAKFGPAMRQRCLELRAAAAKQRLELLQTDVEGYKELLATTKDSRFKEIIDETDRIMKDLQITVDAQDMKAVQQPKTLCNCELMPHQIHGLQWLASLVENNMSGILADDMGLGKTIQILALLAYLMESKGDSGPHLIIVPKSLLMHWSDELLKWLPSFQYMVFKTLSATAGGAELARCKTRLLGLLEGDECQEESRRPQVVLTTPEMLIAHDAFLTRFPWQCLIVDEGHRLKNFNTKFSEACRAIHCRLRFVLTGTPLNNNLGELWSLLSFVAPKSFSSLGDFEQWFALPPAPKVKLIKGKSEDDEEAEVSKILTEEEELLIIHRLHGVLRPFLLRRTKDLVLKDLPPKREVVIWCPMSAWQKVLYRAGLRRIKMLASRRNSASQSISANCGTTMALRKATNHPFQYLECGAAPDNTDLIRASGKLELLDRLLPRLLNFGHRVLIFSQFLKMIDILQRFMLQKNISHARLDGAKSDRNRAKSLMNFMNDPSISVFLLSTRAGSLGLNLQAADTVILFDSDWNPQVDLQAMDRAHRIGQTKPVLVVRLLTPTAMERGLYERAVKKLDLERKVIGAGRFHQHQVTRRGQKALHEPENEDEDLLLKTLLREARQGLSAAASEHATPLAEVNELVARSAEEKAAFDEADELLFATMSSAFSAESTAVRLERCGRLMKSSEVPADKPVDLTADTDKKSTEKESWQASL